VKYLVTWGPSSEQEITSPRDLDAVLRRVAAVGQPLVVGVYYQVDSGRWVGVDIGVGHPQRSFVFLNERGGGYGREDGVAEWDDDIVFDDGGQPTDYHPEETRVRAQTALRAAREFVATGHRPSCVTWEQ
jgi:Immunity protein Imm1